MKKNSYFNKNNLEKKSKLESDVHTCNIKKSPCGEKINKDTPAYKDISKDPYKDIHEDPYKDIHEDPLTFSLVKTLTIDNMKNTSRVEEEKLIEQEKHKLSIIRMNMQIKAELHKLNVNNRNQSKENKKTRKVQYVIALVGTISTIFIRAFLNAAK